MVAGELFEVCIDELIARREDQRGPELAWTTAGLALPVSLDHGAGPGRPLIDLHHRAHAERARAHDLGSDTILIEENTKRNRLVGDERFGVPATAGADRNDLGAGGENLVISITDLTGPFATRHSTEVAQEQHDGRLLAPEVADTLRRPVGVHEHMVGKGGHIERHTWRLPGTRELAARRHFIDRRANERERVCRPARLARRLAVKIREDAMAQPTLECTGLRKVFDDLVAVDDVGFHIDAGETYGLFGPNGAGKTTSISMIAGLLTRDGGSVSIGGTTMTTTSTDAKALIGLVPQDIAVYPDLTARENLVFFGKLYGMSGKALTGRVDEVLDVIGLTDRAGDRADEFSGGMKRRLNIGIGLLHKPSLLILDEPTVGVDPQSRNAILESVEQLSGEGMAVLYTTHYMEEAERLCDRVGIIDHGEIKAEGTRRELVQLVGQRDRIRLAATGGLAPAVAALTELRAVAEAGAGDGVIELLVLDAGEHLTQILSVVTGAGVSVTGVDIDEPNLESVFLHLTGRALRD